MASLKIWFPTTPTSRFSLKVVKLINIVNGAVVPIVKTGSDLCPWATLLKYLSQAKLALLTSPHADGDSFLFWQYSDEI